MLSKSICILVVACICLTHGFIVPSCPSRSLQKLGMSSLKPEGALVDRALDSALDFLQDGDVEREAEEVDEFDMFDIFEESPEIEVPYDLISELEEKEAAFIANRGVLTVVLNKATIQQAVKKWQLHPTDVGSAEVQIAICNEKVKYLTKHLLANKRDAAARRGLNAIVTARRKFLNYLHETNQKKAEQMISELGIRWRAPGRLWDKEAKYGAFKNTKSKWMKLRQISRVERDAKAAAKKAVIAQSL